MLVDMQAQFQKAQDILLDQKSSQAQLGDAFDILSAFQNINPKDPQTLFGMATVAARRKQSALAVLLYEVYLMVEKNPIKHGGALLNLGQIHHLDGKRDVAIDFYNKAIERCKLTGNEPQELKDEIEYTLRAAQLNIAGSCISTGNPKQALERIDAAMAKWPDAPEMVHLRWNKALLKLELGEYAEGFDLYHEFPNRHVCREYLGEGSPPTWDGTKEVMCIEAGGENGLREGKRKATVIVYGEQGIGDEIMFASMIPDLMKDCNVVFDSHLRLAEMFRNSFNIPVYATREFNAIRWKHNERIDYKIPIGSLGKWYRRKDEEFPKTPYLVADSKMVQKAKERLKQLGDKPCIGISWRGGTKGTNSQYRNISLDVLKPLLEMDVNWISLNYQPTSYRAVDEFYGRTGLKIHHFKDLIEDYDMTAALVKNLDLVISVPQSVVHLAGAIGTPTWQMCPKKAMWQMGPYGKDMPWYKCAKNFWQDDTERWEPVIETIKGELLQWNLSRTNTVA